MKLLRVNEHQWVNLDLVTDICVSKDCVNFYSAAPGPEDDGGQCRVTATRDYAASIKKSLLDGTLATGGQPS